MIGWPKTPLFVQESWRNDLSDTRLGPFKNANYSKNSAGLPGSALLQLKDQLRVVKVNKLAQNNVFGQISRKNYVGDTLVGPLKK